MTVTAPGRLEGRVAVVTGGAGGLGAGIVRRFAAEGAHVVVTDRLQPEARAVVESVREAGGSAEQLCFDVTASAEWDRLGAHVRAAHGRLDVMVCSAGLGTAVSGDTEEGTAWERLMGVNATGTMLACRTALDLMGDRGGSIITISSIAGVVATSSAAIDVGYHASKGAVRQLTRALAVQAAARGVRVNCIVPGVFPPMRGSRLGTDADELAALLGRVPLRRVGAVEDVAGAALFLASDDAAYVTGIDLPVDGGFLAL
ncbi:SDR family NAD(P)-dependent oxidoreductase [Nocardioides acrostichi]|uniref:SDR family oxidoreductase n=1 Tax=Nocardioides acrostichi TaxID=2784339 RepID=A0A930YCL1_9ACTN|nr:SDR family oxidoreductase [Nocardioides acrostichi]MBF4161574.1 SDR family oxidoreductase [Nocardioides acrostichi]